jgi:hypothetical protein
LDTWEGGTLARQTVALARQTVALARQTVALARQTVADSMKPRRSTWLSAPEDHEVFNTGQINCRQYRRQCFAAAAFSGTFTYVSISFGDRVRGQKNDLLEALSPCGRRALQKIWC